MLTSCSLMVGEPGAAEAVALASETPSLSVGLHLALIRATPVLPPERIPLLVGRDGRFEHDPLPVGIRYFCVRGVRQQVRAEIAAQFERFAATGLPLSHIDAHLHFHLHPLIFAVALDLAPAYGCRHIRIPLDRWRTHRAIDPAEAYRQAALWLIFAALCRRHRRRARGAGLGSPGYCFGLFRTGRLDAVYLARLARALPDGIHELHCHPDHGTPAGRRELAGLLSEEFRAALRERGVGLASYGALSEG